MTFKSFLLDLKEASWQKKEFRDRKEFDRGYTWALERHNQFDEPRWYLQDYIDGHGDKSMFDEGAQAAIWTLPDDRHVDNIR